MNGFSVGDVVHLRSGSPPLTVVSIREGAEGRPPLAVCRWYAGRRSDQLQKESFPFEALARIPESEAAETIA